MEAIRIFLDVCPLDIAVTLGDSREDETRSSEISWEFWHLCPRALSFRGVKSIHIHYSSKSIDTRV